METADAIVKTPGELRERRPRDSQESLHLMGSELQPKCYAGAPRIGEEHVTKPLVGE
jgi:hypothetical protein